MTADLDHPADRGEEAVGPPTLGYVRDLTADELHEWKPIVGTLADGLRAVWIDEFVRDPAWDAIPDGLNRVCSRRDCGRPAVAEFRRTRRVPSGTGTGGTPTIQESPQWWPYCDRPEHLYGARYVPPAGDRPAQLLQRIIIDPQGNRVG